MKHKKAEHKNTRDGKQMMEESIKRARHRWAAARLHALDERLGVNQGAKRERARLAEILDQPIK